MRTRDTEVARKSAAAVKQQFAHYYEVMGKKPKEQKDMCIVSAVSDDFMKRWPDPFQPSVQGGTFISWKDYEEYQRLKRMAEELDRALNQPDCVKPEVDKWEQQVKDALKRGGMMS